MPCYRPIKAYRSKLKNNNGKYFLVFNRREGYVDIPFDVPCGKCIGCKAENARQWAIRIYHEASMNDENCFVTLTYNEENMNNDKSLCKDDFQKFMKRLRRKYDNKRIRFFHCGEYGNCFGRPHYHVILFGIDFHDRCSVYNSKLEFQSSSKELSELWPYGFNVVGEVNFKSALYVAKYVVKKELDYIVDKEKDFYNVDNGEVFDNKELPYATMSRRKGIGFSWINKYYKDVYPSDFIVIDGVKMRPPDYYDNVLKSIDIDLYNMVKSRRRGSLDLEDYDFSYERLAEREFVKQKEKEHFERSYENEKRNICAV